MGLTCLAKLISRSVYLDVEVYTGERQKEVSFHILSFAKYACGLNGNNRYYCVAQMLAAGLLDKHLPSDLQ